MGINTMEAGREMDSLVAEKVMGLTPDQYTPICYAYRHSMDEDWCYDCQKMAEEAEKVPSRYSISISAAWEVVEKLRLFRLLNTTDWNKNILMWHAGFLVDNVTVWIESDAPTAPLAICRAALKAVDDR